MNLKIKTFTIKYTEHDHILCFEEFFMDFVKLVIDYMLKKTQGAIQVVEGKKQWIFYFDQGNLVMTKSNIKSEQGKALKEKHPDASKEEILEMQALIRIQKGFGSLVQITETQEIASKFLSYNTAQLLLTSILEFSEAQLQKSVENLYENRYEISSDIPFTNDSSVNFLSSMDGSIPSGVHIRSSGIDHKLGLATLWMAYHLKIIKEANLNEAEILFDFDLAALIAKADQEGRFNQQSSEEEIYVAEETDTPKTESILPQTSSSDINDDIEKEENTFSDEDDEFSSPQAQQPAEQHVKQPVEQETQQIDPILQKLREIQGRIELAENHFEVLGHPWDAPTTQFATAFRNLSIELHPDRYNNASDEIKDLATNLFDKIREAWENIEDEEKRKAYTDKHIHGIKTDDELAMEQLQAIWASEEAFKKGMGLFNQGRFQQAHPSFQKAAESDPNQPEFKGYLGFTTFMINRSKDPDLAQEGMDMIREAIEINQDQDKKLDSLWVLYGRAYREKGDVEKAKKLFVKALKMNPSNPDAKRELSRISGDGSKKKAEPKKEEKKGGFFGSFFGKK